MKVNITVLKITIAGRRLSCRILSLMKKDDYIIGRLLSYLVRFMDGGVKFMSRVLVVSL